MVLSGNNTYPSTSESKYRNYYFKKFNKILDNKGIKSIYIIETRKQELKKLILNTCYKTNVLLESNLAKFFLK